MARILVIDDSIVMRKNLCTIFTENGHEVVGEGIDGKQAILLYSELKPDLVTMDITMPKMNGVEAVGFIIKKDINAKIVMISALNQKQMVFEALKNGAKHYVIKPIDPAKLIGIVNEVLDQSNNEFVEEKEESIEEKHGFTISNTQGEFVVSFNENLNMKDQAQLETAIKGLLFISPLSVSFDFNNITELSDTLLQHILNIGRTIAKSGGKLQYRAKEEIMRRIQEGK